MIAYLPLLIALVGILLYFISANGKVQETGRIMFVAGLLAFLMQAKSTGQTNLNHHGKLVYHYGACNRCGVGVVVATAYP